VFADGRLTAFLFPDITNFVPLSRENLIQVLSSSMKLLRPDHQIDIRQPVEQRLPAALRHATHKPEHHVGPMTPDLRGETVHLADCLLLCRISHAAGIEQHHVSRPLGRRQRITFGDKLRRHGFRIALVHLTTVGFNEDTWHIAQSAAELTRCALG
jgi:hypothetical protein